MSWTKVPLTLSSYALIPLITPSLSSVTSVLIDQAAGRSLATAPPRMQVPPRTPEDRAAIAQRTHHPANSALNRRAAPSAHALRSTTSKTYRDRIDSRGSAGSTPDKGSKGPCRADPGIGHTQRHQSTVQSKWMGLVSHPFQARCSLPSLNQSHQSR